jgi:NADPH:quinone reductase-like Zn-dependent oxidoreductase
MVKAIRFDKAGGPEVMKWVDVEVGEPGNGEIRIKQHAVGLNYIDVYFRTPCRCRAASAWKRRARSRRWVPVSRA